ncbi:MAG: aconitate hydratase [Chitinispirillaceae bacterium]|nr:aconitate hydratase [Chitinispirillaceae bacterium]
MGKNIVQKIIDAHIVTGTPKAGEEVGIHIDQTLTQDATGTMAYLQFEAMGFDRIKTEVSVSYVDHNTIQEGFENADDHKYLESVAAKFGIHFSRPGNGICHQVHLERFGAPGKTLLGSDSHTPTGGGIGMIAIGAGGLDVAVAMGGGPFYCTYPRVIKVELSGTLQPWVAAKDIILKVLSVLSTKGNVGCVVEYGGRGVAGLSVPERATITNMGAELGVTTSVFPSDATTKAFLAAQGREEVFTEITADSDAEYDRVIQINLSELEPMTACPHSPDNIKTVREIGPIKVDQVMVGSCTNSSLRDIMTVAAALKGRQVAPGVSFGVACGSRQVFEMASRNGALADIIAAGTRILELACGFCIGNSQAPKTDAVSIRTNNRNFYGRSGTLSAQVYLVSPETAVAAALSGTLTDPRDFFGAKNGPSVSLPDTFLINDNMIVKPQVSDTLAVKISRGPNIGDPPSNSACPESLDGVVTIKVGDKITTDHIMPAGNRLKYRSNIPAYAEYVFEREDPQFAKRAAGFRDNGLHNLIIAGESYGQGSSREHAAICPMFLGVKMVVAKSMERIHRANLINFGIVPALFENPSDYDLLETDARVSIASYRQLIEKREPLLLSAGEKNIPLRVELTDRELEMVLAGGLINATKNKK